MAALSEKIKCKNDVDYFYSKNKKIKDNFSFRAKSDKEKIGKIFKNFKYILFKSQNKKFVMKSAMEYILHDCIFNENTNNVIIVRYRNDLLLYSRFLRELFFNLKETFGVNIKDDYNIQKLQFTNNSSIILAMLGSNTRGLQIKTIIFDDVDLNEFCDEGVNILSCPSHIKNKKIILTNKTFDKKYNNILRHYFVFGK